MTDEPKETALATTEQEDTSLEVAEGIRLPDIAHMDEAWQKFTERQDHFKQLILSRLEQGKHYGFPPGCEQKYDAEGNVQQWNKRDRTWTSIPKAQWQPKPSLYVAGALELRDLFKMLGYPVRAEYTELINDGKRIVSKCTLIHENTGQVVGEGKGAYSVGTKGADENTAIQMADNRAFKSAIRRTIPCCASLFTQDGPENAPQRPEPVKTDRFAELLNAWVSESVGPASPLFGYNVMPEEEKACRTLVATSHKGKELPETPQAAIDWLKANATVLVREGEDGQPEGVEFVKGKLGGVDKDTSEEGELF